MTAPLGSHQASGKLILLGEHFVVHAAPALAIPLRGLATTVRVHSADGGALRLHSDVLPEARTLAESLLRAACQRLGLDAEQPWIVQVESDIPVGFGLGSSAAFCVALTGALAKAAGQPLELEALNEHAHELERIVHGNPSGIDNTVATFGAALEYRRGADPRHLEVPPSLRLVVASSGAPGSTKEAVAGVGRMREEDPSAFGEILAAASDVIEQGIAAFEADDMARLGPLLTRNHALLKQVNVSTPLLDGLVDAALSAGALGAKMTGGGLGGMTVALVSDADAGQRVATATRDAGATETWQLGAEAESA